MYKKRRPEKTRSERDEARGEVRPEELTPEGRKWDYRVDQRRNKGTETIEEKMRLQHRGKRSDNRGKMLEELTSEEERKWDYMADVRTKIARQDMKPESSEIRWEEMRLQARPQRDQTREWRYEARGEVRQEELRPGERKWDYMDISEERSQTREPRGEL